MKAVIKVVCFVVLVTIPGFGFAAEMKNAVSLVPGFGAAPDATAVLVMGEYERQVAPNLSVSGRLATVSYDYDEGNYEEEGDSIGIEAGVRFYPMKEDITGFYFGANIGFWTGDWEFTEGGLSGSGDSDAINVNATAGYKIPLSDTVYLQPAAILGNFFSVDDSCTYNGGGTCSNEAELGFYLVATCGIGFNF
jgi:hypothetical protein